MRYPGSKASIARELLPFLLEESNNYTHWVEPFCGGCNMLDKIQSMPRIGADCNYYLIEMWKAVSQGWMPLADYDEFDYYWIKENKDADPIVAGYLGTAGSFGGKFFGGFARGNGRNFVKEAYNNAMNQFPKLQGVKFVCSSYLNLEIPPRSLIYCDPPYAGTLKYFPTFNHTQFWQWCREKKREGHQVFISETNAPPDFDCVWLSFRTSNLKLGNKSTVREGLYRA